MKNPAKPHSIQVIDRAAALLDVLAVADKPITLKVLAAECELHTSTAFRILAALGGHGFVEHYEGGLYRLGARLLALAGRVQRATDLREIARPVMEKLRDEIGESVNLTVREGNEVVYIERAIPNRMMRVEQVIGSRAPLHVTAVGKLFLSEGGDDAVRAYARATRLPAYTVNTFSQSKRLQQEILRVRERGYALDNEEAELGVGCIGAPVRDAQGTMVAGLSISAPRERRRDAWIPLVTKAAREISERLGYVPKK
jgi:DNA-binding IclR family transcriptional regulator